MEIKCSDMNVDLTSNSFRKYMLYFLILIPPAGELFKNNNTTNAEKILS